MLYVNPVGSPQAPPTGGNEEIKRRTSLEQLEQLFAFQLMQEMRKTVPDDTLLGAGGMARDTYNEMLDDALAGEMARTGQLGVAKQVETQLREAETVKTATKLPGGYLSLHPETKSIPLQNAQNAVPLKPYRAGFKTYSLIKSPMPLADN